MLVTFSFFFVVERDFNFALLTNYSFLQRDVFLDFFLFFNRKFFFIICSLRKTIKKNFNRALWVCQESLCLCHLKPKLDIEILIFIHPLTREEIF